MQATHLRLVFTANMTNIPLSCRREVSGTATYSVTGWAYKEKTILFLLPATTINLATLILFLVAMCMGEKVLYEMDPTDPRSLLIQKRAAQEGKSIRIELGARGPRR